MRKIYVLFAIVLLVLCFPGTACADEAYDILDYDVHIVVSENNIADVTETITVDFLQQRHGIRYYLQYRGTEYYYIDDEWIGEDYQYVINDFDVAGQNFELSKSSDGDDKYLAAKIGDEDTLVYGEQTYVITYKCDIGDNGYDTFDDFYRNIITGYDGDTIEKASFLIEFPKDFDETLVNVTMGEYGSLDTAGVYWEKDGNAISGYTLEPIYSGESLTIRAEFPDDYFVGESNPQAAWNTVIYVVSTLCVLLAFALWVAFGRDRKIYPTVEFYAPDGLTPAEVGYIIDGCVDNQDVIALLMYWADKGYLKIAEKGGNDFDFIKLGSLPPDARQFEKTMFNKLFSGRDTVSVSSLKQTFYTTIEATKNGVANSFEGVASRRVFTKTSKKARAAMGVITMIPVALATFAYGYYSLDNILWALGIAVLVGWLISLPVFTLADTLERWRSTGKGKRMFKLVFAVVILIIMMVLYIFIVPVVFDAANAAAVFVTFVTSVSTVIMAILTVVMRKRTAAGR